MPRKIMYWQGQYVPMTNLKEDLLTPGKKRLNGVFETLRVDQGHVHDLEGHIKRLLKGLKVLKIAHELTPRSLATVARGVIAANPKFLSARLRFCVFKLKGQLHTAGMILPYLPIPQEKYAKGLKLGVIQVGRKLEGRHPFVKSLDYGLFAKAYAKAKRLGCDDALLMNACGEIVESSRANVFVRYQGKLLTPPLSSGCLAGITRQKLLHICRRLKIPVIQKKITVSMLQEAEGVYLTNSMMGFIKTQCVLAPGGRTRYN